MQEIKKQTFCGRDFSSEDITLIQDIVATFGGISRRELAHTVSDLRKPATAGGGGLSPVFKSCLADARPG